MALQLLVCHEYHLLQCYIENNVDYYHTLYSSIMKNQMMNIATEYHQYCQRNHHSDYKENQP